MTPFEKKLSAHLPNSMMEWHSFSENEGRGNEGTQTMEQLVQQTLRLQERGVRSFQKENRD